MTQHRVPRIKNRLLLPLALLFALFCAPAQAAFQSYFFNVDMTGLTPSPIYSQILLSYSIQGDTAVGCAIYDGHDLSGNYINGCAGKVVSHAYTEAAMMDGIFSIGFAFDDVAALATPFTLVGIDGNGARTAPVILMDVNRVPEPASLLLISLGLLGIALLRQRRPAYATTRHIA